jgi:hypothetical protein
MATNQLTGDYDAVVQIAIRQINGLLATLHSAPADEPLKLQHSVRVAVGGVRRPRPELDDFSDWVVGIRRESRSRLTAADFRGQLIGAAPPGAAARIVDTLMAFDESWVLENPPGVVRGRADVQLSTVTISVPEGSTSEVTIHAHIRAHYHPAPGTTALPAPIHGEVRATFDIRMVEPFERGRWLVITPSADDAKIQFIPALTTGPVGEALEVLSASEAAKIATQIRQALRKDFKLAPVDLPDEFPFREFKGVGTGAGQAIALGLQLSDAASPASGLTSVTQSFVGPSGFAFAVSKEFVESVFKPTKDALLQFKKDVEADIPGPNPTYHVSVTSVEPLQFNDGSLPTSTCRPIA